MGTRAPLTGPKRLILAGLRIFIGTGSLLILLSLLIWAYPPIAVLGIHLMHRNSICPAWEVMRGANQCYARQKARQRLMGAIRLKRDDPAGFRLWSTPDGGIWLPKGSETALPILLAQQEVDIYGLGGLGAAPGDIVLDCGAHVGLYTRRALRAGARLVVAIEPAPSNLECLRRNLKAEIEAGRVLVCPKGVWDREARLPLFEDASNTAGDSFVEQGAGSTPIGELPLTTIDALVADLRLTRVDFIKLDIKGATGKALIGGLRTLKAYKPRLAVSTEEDDDDPRALAGAVEQLGAGYRPICGSCVLSANSVQPDVLFFR
ncbi:MAG: FkbM family methyltransferase [Acidobacteriales bacterium]|nr:FkbM family methyltransferase [Terriglobales bacterium]